MLETLHKLSTRIPICILSFSIHQSQIRLLFSPLASSLYLPVDSSLCFVFKPVLFAAFFASLLALGKEALGNFLSTAPNNKQLQMITFTKDPLGKK